MVLWNDSPPCLWFVGFLSKVPFLMPTSCLLTNWPVTGRAEQAWARLPFGNPAMSRSWPARLAQAALGAHAVGFFDFLSGTCCPSRWPEGRDIHRPLPAARLKKKKKRVSLSRVYSWEHPSPPFGLVFGEKTLCVCLRDLFREGNGGLSRT